MYHLTFYRNNQPVMRHELKGTNVSIGRDPSCDIQLIEDDVSRIHASVAWNDRSYTITDKSTNGTFVNDKRIKSHSLETGDLIALGDWRVKFENVGANVQRDTVVREASPTKILKYEANKKELVSESIELTVTTPDGVKNSFDLAKASIGASNVNDIIIANDPYVSGNHCVIKCVGDMFILEDLNSKNGTLYNNKKVSQEPLPKHGEFFVGKSKIKFSIKQSSEKLKPTVMTSMGPIIGKSLAMRELFSLVERIAPSDATACIIGASGTGKELIARHIHEMSPRHMKPFIAVNCGAIPENLIESELFGHEKGSFTNATSQHKGVFEQADGGTLFLDEIGEMPLDLQTRLLRVLETRQIRRIGGKSDIPVDARIITATNCDLKDLVRSGDFREDLFFRLYVLPLFVPTLRERKEDVPVLTEHFLTALSPTGQPKKINDDVIDKLVSYNWPGNVRELKNTIQRAILVSDNEALNKEDIIFSNLTGLANQSSLSPLDEQEKRSVLDALECAGGNSSEAARRLGVARTTLVSMVRRFGIDIKEFKTT